jgi:hypothetical protein
MDLAEKIDESLKQVLETIASVPEKDFNYRQNPETWSAGEVLEHLCILEELIYSLFSGPLEKTDRSPDEKINLIRATFLNLDKKLNAPSPIGPTVGNKDYSSLINRYNTIRKKLKEAAETQDLNYLCLGFEHRFFGKLTKFEWLYFCYYHSLRHCEQIKNIFRNANHDQ